MTPQQQVIDRILTKAAERAWGALQQIPAAPGEYIFVFPDGHTIITSYEDRLRGQCLAHAACDGGFASADALRAALAETVADDA